MLMSFSGHGDVLIFETSQCIRLYYKLGRGLMIYALDVGFVGEVEKVVCCVLEAYPCFCRKFGWDKAQL